MGVAGTIADPIKNLMAEMAAEDEAAAAAGTTVEGTADDGAAAEGAEAAAEGAEGKETPAVAAADKTGKGKPAAAAAVVEGEEEPKPAKKSPGFVPVSRVNEETAKRRKAERETAELRTRLATLEAAPKDENGKAKEIPVSEADRQRITTEARAQARIEVMVENFLGAGYEAFGQEEFDNVSNTLSELGSPDSLVLIAVEATGNSVAAAKAIYNLGQLEAREIEALFKQSPIRIGARLAALATARKAAPPKDDDDEAEVPAGGKGKGKTKQSSSAPAPLKAINGARAVVDETEINDEISEELFTERFEKLMDKSAARRH